ncbi:MAG: PAS domain S-box protein [Alphaproteobacteria bacterium]
MVFESVPLMTALDILAVGITLCAGVVFFRYRMRHGRRGQVMVVMGIALTGAFYALDLFNMHGLPLLMAHEHAMSVMRSLHLDINWFVIIASLAMVAGGFNLIVKGQIRTAETLEKSEERLTDFLASASDWFWETDADLRFTHISGRFEEITGQAPGVLLGRTRREGFEMIWRDISDEQAARLEANLRDMEAYRPFRDIEINRLGADGALGTYLITGTPVFDKSGNFRGYRGTSRDITARKSAQDALAESEERFRSLSDLTGEGVAIHENGVVVEVNQAYAEMFGYTGSELVGTPVLEILAPEVRQGGVDRMARNESYTYESIGIRKDGGRLPIEIKAKSIVYKGRQMRVGRIRNLTEVKAAAAAVRESEERHKNITDNLPILIAYIDRDKRYRTVNKQYESWYQRPVSEIVGRRMDEIMLPGSYAMHSPFIDRALAGEVVLYEGEGTTPDGIFRHYRLHNLPHRGDGGEILGCYSLVEDISDIRKAMRELELQTKRLAEAQRIGNMGNWERDFETGELHWSDQAFRIFGQAGRISNGPDPEGFMSVLHEDDRPVVQAALDAAIETDAPYSLDHRIVLPDGELRVVHEEAVVIRDASGRALRMVGTVQDITEQRRAERALRESEQRFQDFANASADWFWEFDANDRLTFISGTLSDSGPAREQFIGKTVAELRGDFDGSIIDDEETAAIRAREPYHGFERRSYADEDQWVRVSGIPIFADDGTYLGYRGSTTNITERRMAEEALRESEAQLRLITDSLPMLITYIGPDERYRFANKTAGQWLAKPISQIVGAHTSKIMVPEAYAQVHPNILEALSGKTQNIDATFAYPDGRARDVELTFIPHLGPDGGIAGFFSLGIDVTDRRALEERFRQALKMEAVGQLTGGIAHEFNNLLQIIAGNIGLLEEDIPAGKETERSLDAINRNVGRGAELTDRLLSFSRRQPLDPKAVEIAPVFAEMQDMLMRTLGETINIRIEPAGDVWPAEADPGQLENALLNLALNSRDAMPGGGVITLSAGNVRLNERAAAAHQEAAPGDYVVLNVIDNGSGMTEEDISHAFEPFFTTKDVGEGTGLGLSMVYGFAQQSGGFAEIESAVGHGTTVRLYLPRLKRARVVEAAEPETPSRAASPASGTILLVEDDADVRESLAAQLKSLGYQVIEAENGAAALDVLSEDQQVDLLITDVVMPGGMSGLDLARRLLPYRPELKVIFTTGYSDDVIAEAGDIQDGAVVLRKPFDKAKLAEFISRALD